MLVVAVAGLTILLTPECVVEQRALDFDIEQYHESLDPETCYILLERIESYNLQCGGDMEILDCG